MQRSSFLTVLFFLALSACAGKTLDGGSTGDTTGAGTGAPEENGAGGGGPGTNDGAGGAIADAPVTGRIGGRTFEPKNIDITFSKRNDQWFLSLDNYANDCGTGPVGDAAEAMTVNVGGLEPRAGTFIIKYADGHGATLQLGVYDESKKSDTRPVQTGTVRLDSWDETPGATITGGLELVADDESAIMGTFTAKVCAPR
jgi:hypothetical protein